MKNIIASAYLPLLMACASALPLSREEYCAQQGMKLTGVHFTQSNASAYSIRGGAAFASGSDVTTSCGIPEVPKDTCFIDAYREEMAPKLDYNENISNKKLVNAIGYVAVIVPGIVAKILYDQQASRAEDRSLEIAKTALAKCSKVDRTQLSADSAASPAAPAQPH